MTFEEFRTSGRDVPDIGAEIPGMGLEGRAGRVYNGHGGLYIERSGDDWMLTLYGEQWLNDDLPGLEARLFAFAQDEGWID